MAPQCFPFYVYDEDGTNRRENITDWALEQFREHYKDKKIDKWAIFHYVYGLLHHPGYREKFADNLKRELPRIPFAPDFRAFAKAGKKLAALHLDYEQLEPWELEFVETPGVPAVLSRRGQNAAFTRTSCADGQPFADPGRHPARSLRVPPGQPLGPGMGRRPVSGQHRQTQRHHSDPNRDDDPEYIVRLVGQVIRVSMETVTIVNSLPAYSTEKS